MYRFDTSQRYDGIESCRKCRLKLLIAKGDITTSVTPDAEAAQARRERPTREQLQ
jgi:hypothetical protein